jgi:hypothetical protein
MKISYEKEVANHSAPSFALGTARYMAKRKQGNRRAGLLSCENIQPGCRRGYHARKATWTGASALVPAQSGVVEDPRARRNFTHENRETSETPAVPTDGRSAGEGLGHTARMYVCEESHRGIVPMNHSNNDGASPAKREG